ncbi:MAG: hypothetical protein Kow00109_08500 [Acidobacteriota bacterium]
MSIWPGERTPPVVAVLQRPCGILVCFLLATMLPGCGWWESGSAEDWQRVLAGIRHEFPGVRMLSTAELAAWLEAADRPKPVLIDARAPDEFAVSHLWGAHRAESVEEVERILGGRRDVPIVVYCSVGYRSARLARDLELAGFQEVYNLEGSIFQWANEGRPVYRGSKQVEAVHPYDRSWGRFLKKRFWNFGEGEVGGEAIPK